MCERQPGASARRGVMRCAEAAPRESVLPRAFLDTAELLQPVFLGRHPFLIAFGMAPFGTAQLAALATVTLRGAWPATTKTLKAAELWDGKPCVIYAVRRMG